MVHFGVSRWCKIGFHLSLWGFVDVGSSSVVFKSAALSLDFSIIGFFVSSFFGSQGSLQNKGAKKCFLLTVADAFGGRLPASVVQTFLVSLLVHGLGLHS